jgi:hypothetical protein
MVLLVVAAALLAPLPFRFMKKKIVV